MRRALVTISATQAVVTIAATLIICATLALLLPRDPYPRHFARPLPAGSRMLHYQRHHAGFDVSYAFVFQVADDQLLNQLVEEWGLTPSGNYNRHPMSLVALRRPPWWPSQQVLERVPVQYEWVGDGEERYRSVWFNRDRRRLYAEYGRW